MDDESERLQEERGESGVPGSFLCRGAEDEPVVQVEDAAYAVAAEEASDGT